MDKKKKKDFFSSDPCDTFFLRIHSRYYGNEPITEFNELNLIKVKKKFYKVTVHSKIENEFDTIQKSKKWSKQNDFWIVFHNNIIILFTNKNSKRVSFLSEVTQSSSYY